MFAWRCLKFVNGETWNLQWLIMNRVCTTCDEIFTCHLCCYNEEFVRYIQNPLELDVLSKEWSCNNFNKRKFNVPRQKVLFSFILYVYWVGIVVYWAVMLPVTQNCSKKPRYFFHGLSLWCFLWISSFTVTLMTILHLLWYRQSYWFDSQLYSVFEMVEMNAHPAGDA